MAGKSINELPEITSVSDSSLMALSSDGKTLGRVAARTLKNSVVGQHISNYIRYINQDIKLELNDGTLTLKAGSKVYVPNGFEADGITKKFDRITIENDLTYISGEDWDKRDYFFAYNSTTKKLSQAVVDVSVSGTIEPLFNAAYFYNTEDNTIKVKIRDGIVPALISFPIAIVTNPTGNKYESINQVFNGFGYIGSTIFALPGTVVSMPNGKEENGVLKNTEVEITSVRTVTLGSAGTTDYVGYLSPTGIDYMLATNYSESAIPPTNKNGYAMWLNTQDNHFYVKNFSVSGSAWELVDALGNICKFTTSSGKITKFESKSVLSLLDTSTFNLVPHIVGTYKNGDAWYRLWSDGWCEQGNSIINGPDAVTTATFLIPFTHIPTILYSRNWRPGGDPGATGADRRMVTTTEISTTSFKTWANGWSSMDVYWTAEGYVY